MGFKKMSLVVLLIVAFTLMLGVAVASAEGEGTTSQQESYSITVNFDSTQGTASASPATATAGQNVTITVTPKTGYELDSITSTDVDVSVTNPSFSMPEKAVTVNVTFKQLHSITVNSDANGTAEADKDQAAKGDKVTITATPKSGYTVDEITVNGTPIQGNTFTMPDKDVTVNASFVPAYKISFDIKGNGTASASPNPAKENASVTITTKPSPATLYRVKSVTSADAEVTGSENTYTIAKMPAKDVTVTVEFEQFAYPITVNAVNAKTATASPNPAKKDEIVKITSEPASSQYELDKITYTYKGETATDITQAKQFTMSKEKDVTVNVTYKAKADAVFKVTVASGLKNGKAEAHPNKDVKPGRTITITPKPDEGYEVDKVTVTKDLDKSAVSVTKNDTTGNYSFKMPDGDATVEVTFKLATLKVNVVKVEHGKVTVDPKEAKLGDTVKITATPDKGYEVDLVVVADADGKSVKVKKANDGTYSFEMPGSDVTVAVTFKEIACPSAPYKDLDTSLWYHEGVDYAIANGLMKGVAKDQFDPYGKLNRAMLVTILYRLEGEPRVSGANPFSDVEAGSWYDKAVTWADSKGIVNGYGNGKFGPMDNITREQMAAMMMRYASYKKIDTSKRDQLRSFVDAGNVSAWALPNMQWAVAVGLIEGSNRRLLPLDATNRAEAATILMRFCEEIMK